MGVIKQKHFPSCSWELWLLFQSKINTTPCSICAYHLMQNNLLGHKVPGYKATCHKYQNVFPQTEAFYKIFIDNIQSKLPDMFMVWASAKSRYFKLFRNTSDLRIIQQLLYHPSHNPPSSCHNCWKIYLLGLYLPTKSCSLAANTAVIIWTLWLLQVKIKFLI